MNESLLKALEHQDGKEQTPFLQEFRAFLSEQYKPKDNSTPLMSELLQSRE